MTYFLVGPPFHNFQFFHYMKKARKKVLLTDFVYTRNMLINIANNQTPNKTYLITTITNFPVQGPYLYELLHNIFHLTAYKLINWKFLCLSLMVCSEQQGSQINRLSTGKLTDLKFIRASLSGPLKPFWKHH